jgi:DNA-directed RNA polymerase sigma subunit (sigma70/sigma32)
MIYNKPPVDYTKIAQAYIDNPHLTLVEVGKMFNRSETVVCNVIKMFNLKRKKTKLQSELHKNIISTFGTLQSVVKTAEKLNIKPSTVSKVLSRNNISVKLGPKTGKPKPTFTPDQEKLFNDHLGLIKLAIKQIGAWRANHARIEFDDLMSAGMIGLWRTVHTFDPSKGTKFMTPAFKAIKCEMLEAIELGRYGRRKRNRDLIDHSKFVEYIEVNEND